MAAAAELIFHHVKGLDRLDRRRDIEDDAGELGADKRLTQQVVRHFQHESSTGRERCGERARIRWKPSCPVAELPRSVELNDRAACQLRASGSFPPRLAFVGEEADRPGGLPDRARAVAADPDLAGAPNKASNRPTRCQPWAPCDRTYT